MTELSPMVAMIALCVLAYADILFLVTISNVLASTRIYVVHNTWRFAFKSAVSSSRS